MTMNGHLARVRDPNFTAKKYLSRLTNWRTLHAVQAGIQKKRHDHWELRARQARVDGMRPRGARKKGEGGHHVPFEFDVLRAQHKPPPPLATKGRKVSETM